MESQAPDLQCVLGCQEHLGKECVEGQHSRYTRTSESFPPSTLALHSPSDLLQGLLGVVVDL